MKLWNKAGEWVGYASCFGSEDHTIPPERPKGMDPMDDESKLPLANEAKVKAICGSCRVRPECIQWATAEGKLESGVWVAGVWIPTDKRAARRVREELVFTLADEFTLRGDDV